MSNFHGCQKLVNLFSFIVLFFFFFFLKTSRGQNPLTELSSRENLVELAGYGEDKLSNVLVTGTVLCEACFEGDDQLHQLPVSGASVTVTCHTGRKKRNPTWAQGDTDEYGDFIVDLPSHLHATPNLDKHCLVKVHHLPKKSPCHQTFIKKHKVIRLSSVGNGIRTYTAGIMKFTTKSSQACMKKRRNKEEMAW